MIRLKYLRAENFKSLRDIDLAFPETGSILIEGLNESGKSTLFEAVYFALYGRPLVADGGIESTVRYGTQTSFVELGLMVDATEIVIARETRVGRQNRAKLTITRPGEAPEVVTSVRAINTRMVAELRLDGETLLNSCFVEQKKLQRLEGMDAAKRLDSLMRLLNLEGLTRLASEFKVTARDDDAIRRATRQRDLAQLRVDVPARELDLEATSRRLAARRILTSLERIDGHRTAIADLEQQHDTLQLERAQLQERLDRILALMQVDQLLASVMQTEVRRQTEATVEERARAAVADVVLVRDVELPKLVERLESVQELAAQAERLEILEAAIRALHEGAAAVADAAEQERRAAALERERDDVDGQLAIAAGLRDALQQADTLIDRIEQLDRARSNVDALNVRCALLEERSRALPAEREREAALTQSARALEEAETNSENTRLRHDLLLEADRALTTAAVARTERYAAADDLQSRSAALDAARVELRDARAALTQSPAPALRSWIRARAASDRANEAREQESDAGRNVKAANAEERRATAAAASATVQGVLLLAGGVAAGIGGAAVLTLLGSPFGILLLAIGVIVGGLGARSLAARGRHAATAEHARNKHSVAQQHQTDLRMTIAAASQSAEQMREAESMLQDLGHPAPVSAAEAQERMAIAEANEAEHDQAQALEREAAAHEAQCNQLHVDAQVGLRSAEANLEATERALAAAHEAAGVGADADLKRLIEASAADATRASERVESVRAQAARLLDAPSPERLRIEAAQARAAIDESDRQVSEVASVAQRLAAESQRADDLERTNGAQRTALHELVAELDLDIVAADDDAEAFRSALEQRLGGFDEADLRRTQARVSADIGAARETAERQRSSAATAWQNAGELASRSVTGSASDTLASAAGEVGGAARRNAQNAAEIADMRDVQRVWDAERSRLAALSAVLGEQFDLQRLRAASTELRTRRSHMEEQVAHLPVVQEQLARAVDTVSRTDTELEAAWRDLDRRLEALGVRYGERAADHLREQVGAELKVLDERTTRGRFDRVLGAIAETAEGIRQRGDRIAEDQREITARLLEVALQSPVHERADIAAVLPEIADDELPLESSLVEERDDLRAAIAHLQAVQRELEAELDLVGVPLDLAERELELAALIRNRAIKKRATGIITSARTRMIDRVLPGTEQNLRLLLPSLTAERYMDAQLDAEYRLSVWDAAAQRYVAKDIFSGGTRDQFSLALRLAFALATLPQELGTTPGFIFLDEPLSAFDQPRTAALVDLLTQGQIAKSFAQIFLISHSRSFDPDLFPYYVRMEDGRVAETNLKCVAVRAN